MQDPNTDETSLYCGLGLLADTTEVRTGHGTLKLLGRLWPYSLGQELGSALHKSRQHDDAIHVDELSGKSHVG